ncbi:MAG: hypothetical protein IT463_04905 [Planctomycetes bacterium]|nr:hypothetical protein [Planctomycetota bacterium]
MSAKESAVVTKPVAAEIPQAERDHCEVEMRRGQAMMAQGMIVTVASIVVYCIINFRGDTAEDFTDMLQDGASPLLISTLVGMGLGSLLWLFGCLVYLRAAMDSDPSRLSE